MGVSCFCLKKKRFLYLMAHDTIHTQKKKQYDLMVWGDWDGNGVSNSFFFT